MDTTLVMMTRDRAERTVATLDRLAGLPEDPPIVVVDNGSSDGTADRIAARHPDVEVVRLDRNVGVAARNLGVRRASTAYVAFADDDSWWEPGALATVADLFDRHPSLGAVTADVTVEPAGARDPLSRLMAASPLDGDPDLPGVPVLGFLACATAVRRDAFLAVGGFPERLHFLGEESLVAIDLASAGFETRYVPEVRVHHEPGPAGRDPSWRRRRQTRNDLWTLWLRRPVGRVLIRSWAVLRATDPATAAAALTEALRGLPWVLRERAVVPDDVEQRLRRLERPSRRERDRSGSAPRVG